MRKIFPINSTEWLRVYIIMYIKSIGQTVKSLPDNVCFRAGILLLTDGRYM